MNSRERLQYISDTSAAIVADLQEIIALEERLQELELGRPSEPKHNERSRYDTSRRSSRPRYRSTNQKICELFS
jgi:hypothetical protein